MMRTRYKANPDKFKRWAEEYRRRVGVRARPPKQTQEQYLAKKRAYARLKTYGIGASQLQRMLDEQDNRCLICRDVFESSKATHVDHDHSTGEVRGILCHHCNVGVGCFRDDPAILRRAADYLTAT